ncbi:MAG: hypothetical protein O3B64_02395 [bacterium]|nr:hypothetical protein [bacterium]MDA1024350.1 hypothetical protein [bacterium]
MTNALKKISTIGIIALTGLFGLSFTAHAVEIDVGLGQVNDAADLNDQSLEETIGTVISILLGLLGIVFLVMVIYAGFLWATAGGSDDNIKKAKKLLLNGVVGIIIMLSAYAITQFVLSSLTTAGVSG